MQDFGTKADDTAGPSGQLSAAEFNNLAKELENSVLTSGQALNAASETQIAQSMFLHGVKSDAFQDSGVADAYVATPVSGSGGVLLPADYLNLGGATITFKASNSNSGASTLNIGQTTGALLGSKAIVSQDGLPLSAGSIVGGNFIQLKYDPLIGAGSWVLLPWGSSAPRMIRLTASTSFTVPPGIETIYVSGSGGGGGGGAGRSGVTGVGSGGGGGGAGRSYIRESLAVTPGQVIPITIGSAGSGGATSGAAGGNGGNTLVGSGGALLTMTGGNGGGGGNNVNGVAPGPAGGGGFPAGSFAMDAGNDIPGGGGGAGASCPFGGGGGSGRSGVSAGLAGSPAFGFGSGGGGGGGYYTAGAGTFAAGGAGAPGIIIIEW